MYTSSPAAPTGGPLQALKYTEGGLLGGRHGGGGDANSFGEWRQQFRNGERCVPCQCVQSTLYIVYNATLNIVYGVTVYIVPVCTVRTP